MIVSLLRKFGNTIHKSIITIGNLHVGGNLTVDGTTPIDGKIRNGYVIGSSFTKVGDDYVYDVVFAVDYADTDYIIAIQGESARVFTFENQTISGFRINTNSEEPMDTFDRVTWFTKKI